VNAAAVALLLAAAPGVAAAESVFFDDFSDVAALAGAGWTLRSERGHPGVPGAAWGPVQVLDDPAAPGNRLLRLQAQTDGTPAGTLQSQLCQQRRFLRGTYAARVRFSDAPSAGADGDPVVQSFYAVAPLRFDFDPEFSEVDFEYLPNGGWGSAATRLYGISWQTARIEPWLAYNEATVAPGSHAGWHVLVFQVGADATFHHVDGQLLARHGGRNVPVTPMSINFNLWFSPGGLGAPSAQPRRYEMDVDWVYFSSDALLAPAQVQAEVDRLRRAGQPHVALQDGAAAAADERCNF